MYYIYDSYHISSSDWKRDLREIRNVAYLIGLVLDKKGVRHVVDSHFHAGYTYFASDGFSYGSTSSNWKSIRDTLHQNGLAFIPSVGPGYDDSSIRPWNAHNRKSRENGVYVFSLHCHTPHLSISQPARSIISDTINACSKTRYVRIQMRFQLHHLTNGARELKSNLHPWREKCPLKI